ncbi:MULTISPECIES: DUF4190 domain-containing protein [unclassified Streptomyces]|uniref:DUF4190 domain-containing protein n=1 Tax=unclassified Streptomyces TaxID=2593676 RepID=UPI0023D926A7|nr:MULTISPECIES: DUF4190 domain-containing protein [unclassified Streptomyces]
MSDDAPTPEVPESTPAQRPTAPPGSARDPWAPPADGEPQGEAPRVSLDKPGPSPQPRDGVAPVSPGGAERQPEPGRAAENGGAGHTLAPGVSESVSPSVHDQRTVASMPGPAEGGSQTSGAAASAQSWAGPAGAGRPFAPPGPMAPPGPVAPAGAANPFAPPGPAGPGAPGGPFAPPPGVGGAFAPPGPQGEPVPPPPIAPDGPGRMPYGHPGAGYGQPPLAGYGPGAHAPGTPGVPAGYYGWPGVPVMPSNGMGTAGLVLGILSTVIFCLWPLAIILGILGVIFGAIGRRRADRGQATNAGQALAGIICGAVGIVLGIGLLVLTLVAH